MSCKATGQGNNGFQGFNQSLMVQTQNSTAVYRAQGEDRTAGRAVSATSAADGPSFASLVAGSSGTTAALPVTASTALKNDPEARSAGLSIEATQPATSGSDSASGSGSSEKKHGGFWNFIVGVFDMLNPLEHIPVISTIYEKITGHKMSAAARIAGDTLYGGPIGAAVGVANVIAEKKTGKDIGENVIAMFSSKKAKAAAPVDVAANTAGAAPAATGDAAAANAAALLQFKNDAVKAAALGQVKMQSAGAQSAGTQTAAGRQAAAGTQTAAVKAATTAAPTAAPAAAADANFFASNVEHHFRTTRQSGVPQQAAAASAGKTINPGLAHPASPFAVVRQPAMTSAPSTPLATTTTTLSQGKAATPVLSTPTPPAAPAPSTLNAVLSSQEAPADASQNQTVPPELIAKKMMASLDQYSAMKTGNMSPVTPHAPGFSAAY